MIEIKKVSDKKDLISFVKFPFKLYKESKYWVPPIIDQEINSFNKDLNLSKSMLSFSIFLTSFSANKKRSSFKTGSASRKL